MVEGYGRKKLIFGGKEEPYIKQRRGTNNIREPTTTGRL